MAKQTIPTTGLWSAIAGLINSNFDETYEVNICQVSITHPTPPVTIAVTGTGDQDLNPANGGFSTLFNKYEQAIFSGTAFTVLADGRVQVNRNGIVVVNGYADISHTNNGTTVGAAFSIERGGSTVFSPRSVHARMPNAGNIGNLSGTGAVDAQVGDIIGLALASDVTGTISIRASSLVYEFKG